jgi:NADH-quinone oxidoreductase subunit J
MSLPVVLFAIVAALTASSAVGVLLSRNVVRMAVYLLFTLIGVSLTYFLLGAEFVGAAQLIVYVGGTLVLLVFGVMLTARGPLRELRTPAVEWAIGGLVGLVLFGLLVDVTLRIALPAPSADDHLPGTAPIGLGFLGVTETSPRAPLTGVPPGTSLMRTPVAYLLPFEIVSIHLLVVLIGAAYLARAKRRRVEGPAV